MELKLAVAQLYRDRAQQLESKGNLIAAQELYQQAIEINRDDYYNYYLLGRLNIRQNELERAKNNLRSAQKLDPNQGYIYYQLGKIWQQQQQYDRAIACYNRTIECDRHNDKFYFTLGELLFRRSRLSEAETNLQQAVKINCKSFWGYYFLGLIKRL